MLRIKKKTFALLCVLLAVLFLGSSGVYAQEASESDGEKVTETLRTPADHARILAQLKDAQAVVFGLPRYVDGTSMSVRVNGNQVEPLAGANWATPIGEMVRSTLAQNLAQLAGPAAQGKPVRQVNLGVIIRAV